MSILCRGALEVSLIHSLLWHLVSFFSVALTKLVQKLDKKSPSKSCLPTNYPSWAVDSSCVVTPSRSSDVLRVHILLVIPGKVLLIFLIRIYKRMWGLERGVT